MLQIRQGDVLLVEHKIPNKTTEIPKENGKSILALGEVTGHHHRFAAKNVKMFRDDAGGGAFCLIEKQPAELVHEEHSKIVLPPGSYKQGYQVEYTPKELRRVAD